MKYVGGGAIGPETKAVLTVMVGWVTLVLEWALLKLDQILLGSVYLSHIHTASFQLKGRGGWGKPSCVVATAPTKDRNTMMGWKWELISRELAYAAK